MKMDDKDIVQATTTGGSPATGEIYRHYQGGLYVVVCRAVKEDTLEPLVIYSNLKGSIWARTLDNWREMVGDVPRFARMGEGLNARRVRENGGLNADTFEA